MLSTGPVQSAIFNGANFSSIATDADGVIQIFNLGAERMLGYDAREMVNLLTPADIADPQELVARARALSDELGTTISPGFEALVFKASRGIEDIYELTYIRKDGSRFPAVVSVTAVRDPDGSIIGYLLIGTDNTARKKAEEALLEAGALQTAIFNSANFSSIATDAEGVIQIFNVGAQRMLGYAAHDVVNRITPADISDPEELVARARALSLELATMISPGFEALVFKASRGIEDIYELTYVRKDGSRFPAIVSVTALRDVNDQIIGYLLIGTDNTARKEVERAQALLDQRLRDQQFYTRSLIESNVDALMTTDPQGIISDVNEQMMTLTGCTRDELIGAPCRNFFTDPARADAAIERVLTENKVSNYELTVRAQDGEETVVSYNAATFHNRDRKLQGVVASARDITELKRYQLTLHEKNLELQHASRMKSEFLATMSHELRTPLNAIIGFSEALKDGLIGAMDPVQTEYIGDIFSSGQHLLSLINDILDLSKVEAGMMTLELEAVDINSLLANSLSIVREKAANQGIRLELDIDEEFGLIELDMRKTKQIVYNLLSNAVKFSSTGSNVALRARHVTRAEVGSIAGNWPLRSFPLAASNHDEFLEVAVIDTGLGISSASMQHLFEAFSQIDSGLARRFEGTGLGLAMVKQLAALHDGTVALASAEGEGANFTVWLPLQRSPEAGEVDQGLPREAPMKRSDRVALVVEDDSQAADVVRRLLEAEGFRVLIATSAERALEIAPLQPLSLITIDIRLPGIDGWEFLQRVRETSATTLVPVVIIAGMANTSMALAHGVTAVLQKPISRAQLSSSLSSLGMHPIAHRTYTVLVVDDDQKAVEVVAAFLLAPAYAVVRAYSGTEAITLAQRLRPDLIVLDLMMPEVSGFDVLDALRLKRETARIPVLVVTAKLVSSAEHAALTGTTGFPVRVLEKATFDGEHFIAEVRRAISPIQER